MKMKTLRIKILGLNLALIGCAQCTEVQEKGFFSLNQQNLNCTGDSSQELTLNLYGSKFQSQLKHLQIRTKLANKLACFEKVVQLLHDYAEEATTSGGTIELPYGRAIDVREVVTFKPYTYPCGRSCHPRMGCSYNTCTGHEEVKGKETTEVVKVFLDDLILISQESVNGF